MRNSFTQFKKLTFLFLCRKPNFAIKNLFVLVFLFLLHNHSEAQVTLTLDYKIKAPAPVSVKSGELWTMQLDYSISSTISPNLSGVKIEIPMPDFINDIGGISGTSHAPAGNFVFTNTLGAKKLTINFINPVPTGSTGVLEFQMRTINGATPDGTVITTCATLSDGSGNTSGAKCSNMTITAQNLLCGFKTLKGGGAVGAPTSYRIAFGFNSQYSLAPIGIFNASNITITDTYPVGATYLGATLYDLEGGVVPSTITQSGNTVTATVPDYVAYLSGGDWRTNAYFLEVTLQYDTPTFSISQSVTNNASVTFTPYGGSPITIVDGSSNSHCTSDLIETHTLQPQQITGSLVKTQEYSANPNINSGVNLGYLFGFTNTGNVPLNNVEITETVPADLIYANMRLDAWGNMITGLQYQTNLNASWTTWTVIDPQNIAAPPLGTGEKLTLIKFIIKTPLESQQTLNGYNIIRFTAGNVAVATPVTNCMEWNASTAGLPSNRQACNSFYTILPPATTSSINYNMGNSPSCSAPYALNSIVTLQSGVSANNGFPDVQDPIVGFFVRHGAEYVPGSLEFIQNTSGITGTPTITVFPNHRVISGASHDLLRITFPSGTVLPAGKVFIVKAKVKLTNLLPSGINFEHHAAADGSNTAAYNPDRNVFIDFVDTNDWDGDGNTTETVKLTNSSNYSCGFRVSTTAEMESIKWVKGLCDTVYSRFPQSGTTVPGGNADYRLVVKNTGNVSMKDIKIVDILPFVGDRGVIDPQLRLSQWRPNLADPISAPSGVSVFYSTESNPCRDEVKQPSDPSPFPSGCSSPNWNTTPPSDITKVQAVKIDFGSIVLNGGDSLVFSWPMRAPINAPTNNDIAWNSFGFLATRVDNNQSLIAAEPPKVGIKVKPGAPAYYGNRVWYDTNQDGIQDASEGGVDGVKVKLFKVSSISDIPNPATDQLINFTITGNGGFYRFSNLQPGFYYAVFCVPAGYQVSPKNTGIISNDSDGSSTTYQGLSATITAITELSSTEDDDTWDQGIYCSFNPIVSTNSPVSLGGTLNMSVNPTTGSYSWAGPNGWSATGFSVSRSNMQLSDAGNYTVNIYQNADGTGCWVNLSADVIVSNCNLSATASGTNVSCNGGNNGTATVTPSGNIGAVTYLWSNGATTQNISSLTAGTYNVTVTESGTCTTSASYTVTEPSAITVTCSKTDVTTNGGSNGTASVVASGGTSPYTYLWSNSATTSNISGLSAGSYGVTVTDANNCSASCSSTVNEPGCNLSATASGTNVSCNGGNNGTATVAANGNVGAVTYLWSNGATTQNISSLTAGTYTVTVTESGTCTTSASYTVTEPSAITVTCSKTDVTTNGGSNGTASVVASGGTSPYTYLWSNGNTTSSISGLIAGTYSVTVTDTNNCTKVCSSAITEPSCTQPNIGTNTKTKGTCTGTTPNNDAKIDFTGITNADKAEQWEGATYGGTAYGTATKTVSVGTVSFTGLKHNTLYTFRFWNGDNNCFIDIILTTPSINCVIPCPNPNCGSASVRKL